MKVTPLKGDQTVQGLADRLLKGTRATISNQDLAAALLRLNPQLNQIGTLPAGTSVLLPPELATGDDSAAPLTSIADELTREAALALQALTAALKENSAAAGAEAEQAQAWLKSDQGQAVLKQMPEFKDDFATTAADAAKVRTDQAALVAGQSKALEKLRTDLAAFQKAGAASASS